MRYRPTLMKNFIKLCSVVALALAASFFAGCNDYNNPGDHRPPAGFGAIIVDNHTYNDIHVFIDGVQRDDVRDSRDKAYDVLPGVHRVVLDERGGNHTYRADIDVLVGRNTILDVTYAVGYPTYYDVAVFFKSP